MHYLVMEDLGPIVRDDAYTLLISGLGEGGLESSDYLMASGASYLCFRISAHQTSYAKWTHPTVASQLVEMRAYA